MFNKIGELNPSQWYQDMKSLEKFVQLDQKLRILKLDKKSHTVFLLIIVVTVRCVTKVKNKSVLIEH